jgi:hypothetical protein
MTAGLQQRLNAPFSYEEIGEAVTRMAARKSPGPSDVSNAHIASVWTFLAPVMLCLFNSILTPGEKLPKSWFVSLFIVIFKGKGSPANPGDYRGIALKESLYKLLAGMVARRVTNFLIDSGSVQSWLHGFLPGRSTVTACQDLFGWIRETMKEKKKAYVVFVDFSKCFDTVDRGIALDACAQSGMRGKMLDLLARMLGPGEIRVFDGSYIGNPLVQATGLAQGDNIAPVILVAMLARLLQKLVEAFPNIKVTGYADDLAIAAANLEDLKAAFRYFEGLCEDYKLTISPSKTKWMRFVKGGRMGNEPGMTLAGAPIERVSSFEYLGITVTPSLTSFGEHVENKAAKATAASFAIASPKSLSLECALELYKLKIEPILGYGAEVIWDHLKLSQLKKYDAVKANFLKRVLGVAPTTQNRLVFLMCQCTTGAEGIQRRLGLGTNPVFDEYMDTMFAKLTDVDPKFFDTPLALVRKHMGHLNPDRHVFSRNAAHGFHADICTRDGYHHADDNCVCGLCGLQCPQYHLTECTQNHRSIRDYARGARDRAR